MKKKTRKLENKTATVLYGEVKCLYMQPTRGVVWWWLRRRDIWPVRDWELGPVVRTEGSGALLDRFPNTFSRGCCLSAVKIWSRAESVCALLKWNSVQNSGPRVLVPSWLKPLPKDFSLSPPNVAGNLQNFGSYYFRIAETNFQNPVASWQYNA